MMPTTCCQNRSQFCCLDSRSAFPCTADVPLICSCCPGCVLVPKPACCAKVKDILGQEPESKAEQEKMHFDLSDTPVGEIRLCNACFCTSCGFLLKYPECIGAKLEALCLCYQCEASSCKLITEDSDAGICCICCDAGTYVVMPTTCCTYAQTFCCLDQRCACPTTDKVPCMLACLGLTCLAKNEVKTGCCPLIGDIVPSSKDVGKVLPMEEEKPPQLAMAQPVNETPVQGQMIGQPQQIIVVQQPQPVYVVQQQQPVYVVQG